MVIMNTLRMLTDLSLFYSFAAFIAASYGGSGIFVGALIQCLCFGLSSAAGNKRPLRLLSLIPMGLCWYLYRTSLADCLLLIPTTLYIIRLVFKGDYALDHARQSRIFSLFLKIIPFFIIFGFLIGKGTSVTQITLPFTAAFLIGSVFLLRSLRHTPKIYCQKKYQLVNAFALTAVVVGGCFLGSDFFLGTCVAFLKAFYTQFILPILYLIFAVVALLLSWFVQLFSFIEWKNPERKQDLNLEILDPSDLLVDMGAPSDFSVILKRVLIAVGILLICVLIFLFFRWLNGKNGSGLPREPARMVTRTFLPEPHLPSSGHDSSVIRSIRALYRKYMKLCIEHGAHFDHSATSLDVDKHARRIPGFDTSSPQIRSIYIRARYADSAGKSDLKRIKQLFNEVKRQK